MKIENFMPINFSPKNAIRTIKYKIDFRKAHPKFFDPAGLLTFCGSQGKGKTLSAVDYIKNLLKEYPSAILVTNVIINDLSKDIRVIYYKDLNELIKYFDVIKNDEYGVIYFVDEIQILFNSLLKRGQSVQVLEVISQQRKQRKHIIGTAQNYMRIDKVFRDQMHDIVLCDNWFGILQHNKLIDGDTCVEENGKLNAVVRKNVWFFHSPEMYKSYDTYSVISSYRREFENSVLADDILNQFLYNNNLIKKESVENGN